ncbi:MAG: protein jag [Anaerolineaceae bacterium]|nr:protein jag [Anaerolineaceae bacterium]
MSAERTTLEVIAPTVEEAVQKGLSQLNLREDEVELEVLDSGSRGLFGIGSRQARVKLSLKGAAEAKPVSKPVQAPAAPVSAKVVEAPAQASSAGSEVVAEGEEDEAVVVARMIVQDLLDKMKVHAKVNAQMQQAQDAHDEDTVVVNIEGDDLSILIGRRSETLNALQYITSLIVGKRLNHWVPVTIDVQGYRARRERQLRVLARRMADQAIHTGKRQTLEPMPAAERRVIHMELRDHPDVVTESTGEEPNRKITIVLKK